MKDKIIMVNIYEVYWKHPETKTWDYLDSFIYAKNSEDAIEIAEEKLPDSQYVEYEAPKKVKRTGKTQIVIKPDSIGEYVSFFINGKEDLDGEEDLYNYDYLVDKFLD
tara:strand:+ start:1196 stop:1519 length:324 start_codon:yes stop_codon:yes gene_type:complete